MVKDQDSTRVVRTREPLLWWQWIAADNDKTVLKIEVTVITFII